MSLVMELEGFESVAVGAIYDLILTLTLTACPRFISYIIALL